MIHKSDFFTRWRISKSLVTFVVEKSNYELPPRSLLFAGFDVTGSVVSNGEPIAGVNFVLFPNGDTAVMEKHLPPPHLRKLMRF